MFRRQTASAAIKSSSLGPDQLPGSHGGNLVDLVRAWLLTDTDTAETGREPPAGPPVEHVFKVWTDVFLYTDDFLNVTE